MARSSIEHSYRLGVLVVCVILAAVSTLWVSSDTDSPVDVLGCVWERATAEGPATTAPDCRQP